ncbi:hypothetical protein H9L19_06260 [Weissella diestrammenae]|uniref:Uncharacterized protein n=1 Tax=Weissella diestrammenae TaxID=1162633 RepID=A0A7G9T4G4_9LACO|nr:hypothetical protein [Weissella diestrammenae]MCM0583525.1 hypothetical protein [Weissella diestrammenae]QNN74989.1 hypothetical protein H9L19_06260 [Weissella diestrammenae]
MSGYVLVPMTTIIGFLSVIGIYAVIEEVARRARNRKIFAEYAEAREARLNDTFVMLNELGETK